MKGGPPPTRVTILGGAFDRRVRTGLEPVNIATTKLIKKGAEVSRVIEPRGCYFGNVDDVSALAAAGPPCEGLRGLVPFFAVGADEIKRHVGCNP